MFVVLARSTLSMYSMWFAAVRPNLGGSAAKQTGTLSSIDSIIQRGKVDDETQSCLLSNTSEEGCGLLDFDLPRSPQIGVALILCLPNGIYSP